MLSIEEISKALQDRSYMKVKEYVKLSWPTFNRLRSGDPSIKYETVKAMSDYLEGNLEPLSKD